MGEKGFFKEKGWLLFPYRGNRVGKVLEMWKPEYPYWELGKLKTWCTGRIYVAEKEGRDQIMRSLAVHVSSFQLGIKQDFVVRGTAWMCFFLPKLNFISWQYFIDSFLKCSLMYCILYAMHCFNTYYKFNLIDSGFQHHQNHLEVFLTHRHQCFWCSRCGVKPENFLFIPVPRRCLMLLAQGTHFE